MNKLLSTASAAVFAAVLSAAPVFADNHGEVLEEIQQGMTGLGMDASTDDITEEQALQIQNVLNGTDDDETKKMAIEALLAE